jgi:type I restriction enzyme S subunit
VSELPNSWEIVPFLSVADLLRGVTYSKADARSEAFTGSIPVLRANNIQNRQFQLVDLVHVPKKLVADKQLICRGDVVVATSSGSISVVGKAAQAMEDMTAGFGAFCGLLRPKSGINTRYFGFFFSSDEYRKTVSALARGVNINNLKREHFETLAIPLAPLAEQKRIADKLEAVLGRVDACRARLDRVPALLKRFRQSVLASATSGGLTAEWRMTNGVNDEWETVPLQDTIDGIEQGWSPKCENEPSTNPTDWAVIKTTAIQEMAFLEYENKRLPKHLKPRPNLEIQPGDILITRAGPRVRAAVTCMVDSVRPRLIVCDKVYRFRAKKDKTTPNYLNVFLNSPLIVQQLDEMKTGISDSGVNLTQSKFNALQVPLPTLPEQQEIVRRVEDLFAFADRIEARLATAQKTVERLTPATLAKAFRGELVPQDPNDEPAYALLERITATKEAAPTRSKPKTRRVAER